MLVGRDVLLIWSCLYFTVMELEGGLLASCGLYMNAAFSLSTCHWVTGPGAAARFIQEVDTLALVLRCVLFLNPNAVGVHPLRPPGVHGLGATSDMLFVECNGR